MQAAIYEAFIYYELNIFVEIDKSDPYISSCPVSINTVGIAKYYHSTNMPGTPEFLWQNVRHPKLINFQMSINSRDIPHATYLLSCWYQRNHLAASSCSAHRRLIWYVMTISTMQLISPAIMWWHLMYLAIVNHGSHMPHHDGPVPRLLRSVFRPYYLHLLSISKDGWVFSMRSEINGGKQ